MKIGFIGCGNMGGALARSVCSLGEHEVLVSDYSAEKAEAFAKEYGAVAATNEEVAKSCGLIFIAVKPNVYPSVLPSIAALIPDDAVVISIAAGIKIETVKKLIGANKKVIRIMPNTPVAYGEGMITYCTDALVTADDEGAFLSAMRGAGMVDKIPESLIDAASALSGCGPAFAYMFIEALADGAVECGLPRDKALTYAAKTMLGASKTLLESGKHPGKLKDEVCSPGGTTIKGVHALEEKGLRDAAISAVVAAYERTLELGKK
ncbi:MAG: pyrroline-5-carboxylate reductase [Clostridia bacterium]|nr:pyrroline-5-carboxylate reductase [Clostridia bacterium]